MKHLLILFCLSCCLLSAKAQTSVENTKPNPVTPSVDWDKIVGTITADHWGVNDMCVALKARNEKMAAFYKQVKPGILRLHRASLANSWIDQENKCWNAARIKEELDNGMYAYKHCERTLLTMDHIPAFIGAQFNLTEQQEDEIAAFFARLPGVIRSAGHRFDMYEFFNENWHPSRQSTDLLPAYWRLLNKVAAAVKGADPTVKVGGSAEAWPWGATYSGFIDSCGTNMDFFSFHEYTNDTPDRDDGFWGNKSFAEMAEPVVVYIRGKEMKHLEIFMNEFGLNSSVDAYNYARNHHGAAWIAWWIKTLAIKGITGMNYWNTEDVNMGLNYNTAVANLYLMSNPYLRGSIAESSVTAVKPVRATRLEILPVITAKGGKSILLINRAGEPTTVINANTLLGGKASKIKGWRLDETTALSTGAEARSNSKAYVWEDLGNVPADIVLNPHGLVLLTDITN